MVLIKSCAAPVFCEKEVLRYAGCTNADLETKRMMSGCLEEAEKVISYKVCYCELPLKINGSVCDFGVFDVKSEKLAKNLDGCGKVLLFAATVGTEFDRLISKYSRISPAKAVIMQAIGSERVESLCDSFCKDYENENGVKLKPRFSPGYGDLALEVQKYIFAILDCPRKIGISLNETLLMSPSKSVTAFVGII